MSLDGFTAGTGGDMSWLGEHISGHKPPVDQLLPQIGSLLIGGHTFHGDPDAAGAGDASGEPYGGAWKGPMIVRTHKPDEEACRGLHLRQPIVRRRCDRSR